MTNKFYIKSKAKTFYKGDESWEAVAWFLGQLETLPGRVIEGIADNGKGQAPTLRNKIVITIKEVR